MSVFMMAMLKLLMNNNYGYVHLSFSTRFSYMKEPFVTALLSLYICMNRCISVLYSIIRPNLLIIHPCTYNIHSIFFNSLLGHSLLQRMTCLSDAKWDMQFFACVCFYNYRTSIHLHGICTQTCQCFNKFAWLSVNYISTKQDMQMC